MNGKLSMEIVMITEFHRSRNRNRTESSAHHVHQNKSFDLLTCHRLIKIEDIFERRKFQPYLH